MGNVLENPANCRTGCEHDLPAFCTDTRWILDRHDGLQTIGDKSRRSTTPAVIHHNYFHGQFDSERESHEVPGATTSEERIIQDDGTVTYRTRSTSRYSTPAFKSPDLLAASDANKNNPHTSRSTTTRDVDRPTIGSGAVSRSTGSGFWPAVPRSPRDSGFSWMKFGSQGGRMVDQQSFTTDKGVPVSVTHSRKMEGRVVKLEVLEDAPLGINKSLERDILESPVHREQRTERIVDDEGRVVLRTHVTETRMWSRYVGMDTYKFNVDPNFKVRKVAKSAHIRQLLIRLLQRGYMFHALSQEQLELVVDSMERREFLEGEMIFEEGSEFGVDDPGLFVLEHGVVDCFKGERPGRLVGKHDLQGQWFGEVSSLCDSAREKTVVARSNGVAWTIPRNAFNNIIRNDAIDEKLRMNIFLQKMPLTKNLPIDYKTLVANNVKRVSAQAGDVIIEQDVSDRLVYIIREGSCEACPEQHESWKYFCGDHFGEFASLQKANLVPRIVALTAKVKLYSLEGRLFEEIFFENGYFEGDGGEDRYLALATAEKTPEDRQRLMAYMRRGYMFTGLSKDERILLMDKMCLETFKEDTVIEEARASDGASRGVYLLDSGIVDVYKTKTGVSHKVFSYTEYGQCFGERSFLNDPDVEGESMITVKARTACKAWYLDAETFTLVCKERALAQRVVMETFFTDHFPPYAYLRSDFFARSNFLSALNHCTFFKGEYLIHQDAALAEDMFFIVSGACTAHRSTDISEDNQMAPSKMRYSARSSSSDATVGEREAPVRLHEAGDFVGEVALLLDVPRQATVRTCSGELIAWQMSKESFYRVMTVKMRDMLRLEVQKLYHLGEDASPMEAPKTPTKSKGATSHQLVVNETVSDLQKRRATLKQHNPGLIFDLLSGPALETVLAGWVKHRYHQGSMVVVQGTRVGDDQPAIFVMAKGRLDVHLWEGDAFPQHMADLHEVHAFEAPPRGGCCGGKKAVKDMPTLEQNTINKYGPILASYLQEGTFFGPLAGMLTGDTWHYSIVAMTDTTVWCLRRDLFVRFIKKPLAIEIAKRRVAVSKVRFFVQLPSEYKRDALIEALKRIHYKKGEYLLKFSRQMDKMFIIIKGSVSEKLNGLVIATYNECDVIGESSMVNKKISKANDLIADCPVETLVLHRYSYYKSSLKQPAHPTASGK
eukprot:GEMP01004370.1.p1 GENE.GEMP01004370.1~~GEMP01004370.1.p1  ORF type:complete len:1171 (+),score=237.06 GEMP01004370.1:194-3706(+)